MFGFHLKKFFFSFIACVFFLNGGFSAEKKWTVAAKAFDFSQKSRKSTIQESLSELLPKLILEQVSEDIVRFTSVDEMYRRESNALLLERQSLFLQLSKEVKTRDSIVLLDLGEKAFRRKMQKQKTVIDDIKKKIDENLQKTEKLALEYDKKTSEEKSESMSEGFSPLAFNPFSFFLVKKDENLIPESRLEHIAFYKDDVGALFKPSKDVEEAGVDSYPYEKAVVDAKINGLVEGKITIYDSYFSVTCTLSLYPGRKELGCVTEVGNVSDFRIVARNIASYLVPLVTNNAPVELFFDVSPKECFENALLKIDGVTYPSIPKKIVVHTGKHSIQIESRGYISKNLVYDFEGAERFILKAEMEKKSESQFVLNLANPVIGSLYADGEFVGNINEQVSFGKIYVNDNPIIGQFISEQKRYDSEGKEDGNLSFFFYVPEKMQVENANLLLKGKPKDYPAIIEKRRLWCYRAYSLLVISVPFTLYATGNYVAAVQGYNSRAMSDLDEIYKWRERKDLASKITIACGAFFGIELVRYLWAANSVLPKNVSHAGDFEISGKQFDLNSAPESTDKDMSEENNESFENQAE